MLTRNQHQGFHWFNQGFTRLTINHHSWFYAAHPLTIPLGLYRVLQGSPSTNSAFQGSTLTYTSLIKGFNRLTITKILVYSNPYGPTSLIT